jgi:hypothetical protein
MNAQANPLAAALAPLDAVAPTIPWCFLEPSVAISSPNPELSWSP